MNELRLAEMMKLTELVKADMCNIEEYLSNGDDIMVLAVLAWAQERLAGVIGHIASERLSK